MKKVCRIDKTNKRPYCLRKPCSYRLDGTCSGPVMAVKDCYSFYTCPQDADPGEHINCRPVFRMRLLSRPKQHSARLVKYAAHVWTRTQNGAILEKSPAIFRVFGPPNFLKWAGLAGMGRLAPYWQRLCGAHLPTSATEIAQRQE